MDAEEFQLGKKIEGVKLWRPGQHRDHGQQCGVPGHQKRPPAHPDRRWIVTGLKGEKRVLKAGGLSEDIPKDKLTWLTMTQKSHSPSAKARTYKAGI